ncbi:hypothetical protein B566_EDAN004163 [Ephemera danica]|nr:hypothetical protein B566_EDAN004163 [Ephemera danica]
MKIIVAIYVLSNAFFTIYGQSLMNGTDELESLQEPESRTYIHHTLFVISCVLLFKNEGGTSW